MDQQQLTINTIQAISGILIVAFGGGVLFGGGLASFFVALRRDKPLMDQIENIALHTIPASALPEIRQIIEATKEGITTLSELTDGMPNSGIAHPLLKVGGTIESATVIDGPVGNG